MMTIVIQSFFKNKFQIEIAMILSISLAWINTFIETYIFFPSWALWILIATLMLDLISAVILSFKRGVGFRTDRFMDSIFKMVFMVILLGIMYNLPKINEVIGLVGVTDTLEYFPRIIYWYLILNTLASAGKNAALAKILPDWIAKFFMRYVDKYKDDVDYSYKPKKDTYGN